MTIKQPLVCWFFRVLHTQHKNETTLSACLSFCFCFAHTTKAETNSDITEVLENVEETTDVALTVGGEEDYVENTRAALVDFVYARLGKKLNKGE